MTVPNYLDGRIKIRIVDTPLSLSTQRTELYRHLEDSVRTLPLGKAIEWSGELPNGAFLFRKRYINWRKRYKKFDVRTRVRDGKLFVWRVP